MRDKEWSLIAHYQTEICDIPRQKALTKPVASDLTARAASIQRCVGVFRERG